ncbi:MAG: retropepsin-like domain-containing protein [Bacteroidales bacterium]|nr:retropepsin-like domain-containing protein [Bacteroidales bacterium]MBR4646972.1 retropepsin-like domain-containing protein [Bacteroidales bacterium]
MYKVKLNIVELECGDYHTLVKGSVGGKPIRMVLDTGASRTCMDAEYARTLLPELQTFVHDGVTAGIGGDDFEVRIADIPDFRLGRFRMKCYEHMALLDFTYINLAYQRLHRKPVHVILGNDFLVAHKAVIDYNEKLLVFEK